MALRSALKYHKLFRHCLIYSKPSVVLRTTSLCGARRCSSDAYHTDTEHDEDDEQFSVRHLLRADPTDSIMAQLNECASVQSVFDVLTSNQLSPDRLSQAVLVLWDLQKIFFTYHFYYQHSDSKLLNNYKDQINTHKDFEYLLNLIAQNYAEFSLDALTCTLLYLNRMGVDLRSDVMQLIIARCCKEMKCGKSQFPLTALSRFVVAIYGGDKLWSVFIFAEAMPIVLDRLKSCKTAEDFKKITICLNKMRTLVSSDDIIEYKKIAEELIDNGTIKKENFGIVIKVLKFLVQCQIKEYTSQTVNKFTDLLKGQVYLLSKRQLSVLFKVFQAQHEPASLLGEIQAHASKLLNSEIDPDLNQSIEENLDLLTYLSLHATHAQRTYIENLLQKLLNMNLSPISLDLFYQILYHIKSADVRLCNFLWDKLYELVMRSEENKLQYLLNACNKYMHFSHDLGIQYRYQKFESNMLQLVSTELNHNLFAFVPAKLSRLAAFTLAFSDNLQQVNIALDHLLTHAHRFSAVDCYQISKAQLIARENAKWKYNPRLTQQLDAINNALNECALSALKHGEKLMTVNVLLRGFVLRKQFVGDLLRGFVGCYVRNCGEFSSRFIKDLTFFLQINNYLEIEAVDGIVDYVVRRDDCLLGSVVDKVLFLCYQLGYAPKNHDLFLDIASSIILRDKEKLSGLSFLQACLSLCYFHKLSDTLIKLIFSEEFLEKLDEELSQCYARTTYPIRVREHLMQLNRAVCLDYPELNVPWFHQKYVEESLKQVPKNDPFHNRVGSTLVELFKNTTIKWDENIFSPYGYRLDFLITRNDADRTAIVLLNNKSFSNCKENLKGYFQLKKRHLEILNYKVLFINYNDWKLLPTQENCIEFIRNKISLGENENKQSKVVSS